jgi:hypothetical protein
MDRLMNRDAALRSGESEVGLLPASSAGIETLKEAKAKLYP